MTAEPVLLGLLVAWSLPGLALGAAAMLAFVARTPLKLVLVDCWRHRWLPRTSLAARIASGELALLALLAVYVAMVGEPRFWIPLAVALPLIVLELWYDMRSRGRRLIPELAGALGIGCVAASIALVDGASARLAWGLWFVLAVRSLAAIPYVRVQVSRAKNHALPRSHSDRAQVAALTATFVASYLGLIHVASSVVLIGLSIANLALVRTRQRRAVLIGIEQTVAGLVVILTTAVAANLA